jgi:parvulin-like peptidyl-prolyl isomerase
VNGRDVTVEEYASYLLASIGKTRLDEYVNRLLLDEKARGLGIRIEQDEVEGAVQETLDRTIKSQYQGDRDAYVQALARRNRTPEEEASRLRQELYYDMVERRIILESRKVTEADVAARFEELYGEGGVEYVLRHILVSTRPRLAPSGTGAVAGGEEIARRTPREARDRAEEARKAILGGLPFAEAVQKYSDDPATRRTDGRIPRYRARLFGERFHSVVQKLTPEKPLGEVVESPRGYHVVELVEKRATKIEDVRAEISKWLEGSPPSVRERQQLLRDLRAQAKIEGLP